MLCLRRLPWQQTHPTAAHNRICRAELIHDSLGLSHTIQTAPRSVYLFMHGDATFYNLYVTLRRPIFTKISHLQWEYVVYPHLIHGSLDPPDPSPCAGCMILPSAIRAWPLSGMSQALLALAFTPGRPSDW